MRRRKQIKNPAGFAEPSEGYQRQRGSDGTSDGLPRQAEKKGCALYYLSKKFEPRRDGRKSTDSADLKQELGDELADMIHYIVAIAAIDQIDLGRTILEKDKRAAVKYYHDRDLETFLAQTAGE